MQEADIRAALSAHLTSLDLDPELPVVFENDDEPAGNPQYLEVTLLRSPPDKFGLGTPHRHYGIFQVTVLTPESEGGAGAMTPDRVADAVAAHFPDNTRLFHDTTRVRILQTPAIASGYSDEGYWRVPVSIYYEAWD